MRTDILFGISGALFFIAAFRDSFFPGLLQISARHASWGEALGNFSIGCFFCILAANARRKQVAS
jgi:hypothetical protein